MTTLTAIYTDHDGNYLKVHRQPNDWQVIYNHGEFWFPRYEIDHDSGLETLYRAIESTCERLSLYYDKSQIMFTAI